MSAVLKDYSKDLQLENYSEQLMESKLVGLWGFSWDDYLDMKSVDKKGKCSVESMVGSMDLQMVVKSVVMREYQQVELMDCL
jgi:hypothetical protein